MRQENCDSVTRFCGCYKSKSSAARAMRGWIGDQIEALAFSGAEAFKIIQRLLPDELSAKAEAVLRAEMGKQGFPLPAPKAEPEAAQS